MRFEIPTDKKLVHEMTIPIRWGDMDAMNHVNNTIYFRYFETSRLEWCRSLGCLPNPQGLGPVIVNAFCNFHKQLEYPGEVIARHYATKPGRSSFDTYVTMTRSDDVQTLYASGGATMVWVDFPRQKSVALPDWLVAAISD